MSQNITPSQTLLYDAALTLAKASFAVLPAHTAYGAKCSCERPDCNSPGKHPKIVDWINRATADPEQVRRWWTSWPDANLGVATGSDGLIVIDIDPRNGGERSLKCLEDELGPLPDTATVGTGGGGRHFFFRTDLRIQSGSSVLGPGIDVKATSGFVIAPPSRHVSGKRYEWTLAPWAIPIANLPRSLERRLVTDGRPVAVHRKSLKRNWSLISQMVVTEGRRNDTLLRVAGHLLGRGVHAELAACLVHAFNQTRVRPPVSDAEVDGILDRIAQRELSKEGD